MCLWPILRTEDDLKRTFGRKRQEEEELGKKVENKRWFLPSFDFPVTAPVFTLLPSFPLLLLLLLLLLAFLWVIERKFFCSARLSFLELNLILLFFFDFDSGFLVISSWYRKKGFDSDSLIRSKIFLLKPVKKWREKSWEKHCSSYFSCQVSNFSSWSTQTTIKG